MVKPIRFNNVCIAGIGYVDAPLRVTTKELEDRLEPALDRLGINNRFLQRLTGVHARRFWANGEGPDEVASQAAELAIEKAGIDRARIGLLINSSVWREYLEPSTACFIHQNLQLGEHCTNYDISNACVGFLNGIQIASMMIDQGHIEYAMIVDGEGSRFVVEQTIDRILDEKTDMAAFKQGFATLTLGSGAVAMILGRQDLSPDGHPVKGVFSLAATQYNDLCVGHNDYMKTDATALMTAGIEVASRAYPAFLESFDMTSDDLDHYVIHQVSRPHTDGVIRAFGWDSEKVYRLYPEFGNVGPAGMPITLAKSDEEGNVTSGDNVALLGIGSGLNVAIIAIEW